MKKAFIGEKLYEIESKDQVLLINNTPVEWDLLEVENDRFHALLNNESHNLEVIEAKAEEKLFKVKVNNTIYEVRLKDEIDILLDQLGMSKAITQKMNDLKAPMPGLVLDILVEEGQEVKKGDKLLILEAMKMENILKSPGDGKIKSVKVEKGENVEKNHVLLLFE